MKRATGAYLASTTPREMVQAFVPDSLPPKNPALEPEVYQDLNHKAEMALEDLGIVTEMTGQKKNRSYSYQAYVELLSR